jgi:hypothetical protein
VARVAALIIFELPGHAACGAVNPLDAMHLL